MLTSNKYGTVYDVHIYYKYSLMMHEKYKNAEISAVLEFEWLEFMVIPKKQIFVLQTVIVNSYSFTF